MRSYILIAASLLLFLSYSFAQNVGINTNTPSQALDVDGWVEFGDETHTSPPTEGALRYNSGGFMEFYDGTAWRAISETPRIVRGTVNSQTGAIVRGSGFSVTVNGTGDNTIAFDTPFASSPIVTVTQLGAPLGSLPYCQPTMSDCNLANAFDWITNVTFAGINNNSLRAGCPDSYSDFTAQMATVSAGSSYPIDIEVEIDYGPYTEYVVAYFDWNQDGDFQDTDERYEIGSIYLSGAALSGIVSNTINVPTTALNGTTRMRIVERYNTYHPNACANATYAEYEDYSVDITGGIAPTVATLPSANQVPYVITTDANSTRVVIQDDGVNQDAIYNFTVVAQ